MKNKLIFSYTLILSLFCTTLFAQLSIGVKAGANFASMDEITLPMTDNSNITGYNIGLIAEIGIFDFLAIQPEIGIIQKGNELQFNIPDNSGTETITFDYLEFAALAKLKIGGDGMGIQLIGGPTLSYAIKGTEQVDITTIGGTRIETEEDIDFENGNYEQGDFGLALGGGFYFGLSSTSKLFVDARYLLGMKNILKEGDIRAESLKHRGVNLSAGILFVL